MQSRKKLRKPVALAFAAFLTAVLAFSLVQAGDIRADGVPETEIAGYLDKRDGFDKLQKQFDYFYYETAQSSPKTGKLYLSSKKDKYSFSVRVKNEGKITQLQNTSWKEYGIYGMTLGSAAKKDRMILSGKGWKQISDERYDRTEICTFHKGKQQITLRFRNGKLASYSWYTG